MATNTVTNIPIAVTFYNLTNLNKTTLPKVIGTVVSGVTFPLNGISAVNARFYFQIFDLNGDVVYKNEAFDSIPDYTNPDVLGTSTTTWVNTAPNAPTEVDNLVLKGVYTFTVLQRDESQGVTDLFTRTIEVDFQYDRPTVTVSPSINIFTPSLVLTDQSSYIVTDGSTNDPVTPTITRAWKFYYPPQLDLTPLSGSSATFTTYIFYEGDQTWKLTTSLRYTFSTTDSQDTFSVFDSLVTSDVIEIPESLCDLFCCARAVEARFWASRGTTSQQAIAPQFYGITGYMSLICNALLCGNTDNVADWMTRAKEIANCNDDCDCGDDSGLPRQITGFGNPTITQKIEGVADGSTTVFPIDVEDKNKLVNKSWANGEIQFYLDGILLPSVGAGSTSSFNSATGEFTSSYTPGSGVSWTIQILK